MQPNLLSDNAPDNKQSLEKNLENKLLDDLVCDLNVLFDHAKLPCVLDEACRYAVNAGGKKIRPRLALSSFLACGGSFEDVGYSSLRRSSMCLELLHGYSLVHDDLPCMDDDDLRRGKPTCHVVYGEDVALLVGDVLQSLAFESLVFCHPDFGVPQNPTVLVKLLSTFAPKARRMVAGQMGDILGEQQTLDQNQLEAIHIDKTGALIESALVMGGICANACDSKIDLLSKLAYPLGLAFQVQDDVLDVTATTDTLGKPAGSDDKSNKATYVKLLGVKNAKVYADSLFEQCYEYARLIDGAKNNPLIAIIECIHKRNA